MSEGASIPERRYGAWAAGLIAGLLMFRIALLLLSPSGLHGDEAQYWTWAQDPAFGYYSKPPMIAWIIWTTTTLFGDAEWAVRLASPILHAGTAAIVFLTARRLYSAKAGWWAAALYALMPGVALSSALISTDAALLLFVALFVHAWVRLRDEAGWGWAIGLGAALGLGLLAKYAMIYVLPAFGLALIFDRRTRQAMLGPKGVSAALVAAALLAPNLLWNARNDFATLVHTSDNANMQDGLQFDLAELGEFLLGQFGVFGPVTFLLLLVALWQWRRRARRDGFEPWLIILVLTPLLVICVQALLSRANANWAAAAYASAPVLLAGWAVQWRVAQRWLMIGVALNFAVGTIGAMILISPALVDQVGLANAVKRLRGWPQTVVAVRDLHERGDYAAIAVDNRLLFYNLIYYDIEATAPLRMWRYEPRLNSHAELTSALPLKAAAADDRPVLLISHFETYAPYFERDFDRTERLGEIEIELGGGRVRRLTAYAVSGYRGPAWRD
ncbi:glycosyltransferase family 39 protein [uncultured Algimonas sp.]|uniref:ArnT family glycosyltransferase n=1 Tax=uncultured Algimonas sp. TaxID=1547920 RepID=UPI00260B94E1|nr:glycosyltransferase family 39 protein [uncultured Algimonas sp.]